MMNTPTALIDSKEYHDLLADLDLSVIATSHSLHKIGGPNIPDFKANLDRLNNLAARLFQMHSS